MTDAKSPTTAVADYHVAIRCIMYLDRSCAFHVIAEGTRVECQSAADEEPPAMDVDRRKILTEQFTVVTAIHYIETMDRMQSMSANEPKGVAGEQESLARPTVRLQ